MNRLPNRVNHRMEILRWLAQGDQSYDELLAQYQQALPSHDVDTREAFAVMIGAMIGEGLLQRSAVNGLAPTEHETRRVGRVWLTEKGRQVLNDERAG